MTKIALGTWAWGAGAFGGDTVFGSNTDVENLKPVFEAAMKAGLNLWDTATAYGIGESERILGTLAKQYSLFLGIGRDQGRCTATGRGGWCRPSRDSAGAALHGCRPRLAEQAKPLVGGDAGHLKPLAKGLA